MLQASQKAGECRSIVGAGLLLEGQHLGQSRHRGGLVGFLHLANGLQAEAAEKRLLVIEEPGIAGDLHRIAGIEFRQQIKGGSAACFRPGVAEERDEVRLRTVPQLFELESGCFVDAPGALRTHFHEASRERAKVIGNRLRGFRWALDDLGLGFLADDWFWLRLRSSRRRTTFRFRNRLRLRGNLCRLVASATEERGH